jgi:hypothetical protein
MIKLVKEHIDEDAMGGVCAPAATLNNVPGIGSAVPPGANSAIGSGDRWDNDIANSRKKKKKKAKGPFGKPATQSKDAKIIKESNISPYDKIAQMMAAGMDHKVEFPFEALDSQTNTVKQKIYDENIKLKSAYTHGPCKKYEILSYDEFAKKLFEGEEETGDKEALKYVNGKNELKKIGIAFVFKMIDDKHQIAFIKDDMKKVQEMLEEDGWKKGEEKTEKTGKVQPYAKDDQTLTVYTGEFDHPYVTLVNDKEKEEPEEKSETPEIEQEKTQKSPEM